MINTNINTVDISLIDENTRQKLSGAAMRSFAKISNIFKLSEKEKLILLGSLARSTYYSWLYKAEKKQDITLPLDVLLRISAILGIYKAIRIIFHDQEQAIKWISSPNKGLAFGGQSPRDIMLSGTQDGLMQIRRYLDAWRSGVFAHPTENENPAIIEDEDIIII